MAAWHKLPQVPNSSKSPISKSGVLTIHGFGVRVRMQSGHLEIEDGVADERRTVRLARVGHGLRRLVCISEDGFFTLDALKWLADQRASLIMLDRSGKVSLVTGPTAPSDARLRRAQALAHQNGAALEIMRELMRAKLDGQQQLVRGKLANTTAADIIAKLRESLSTAESLDTVASLEAHAASAYWSAWNELPINFPRQDVMRAPEHWRMFGTRKSVITGSPRLATNPPNAILNYCYALLECETRLAATAVGLDPGIGMLHADTPNRDSLACDIMEAVRPSVDAWLLDWIMREPFRRLDFFEEWNGNCRLLRTLTAKLSETMSVWGKLVAPWAEYVARSLWTRTRRNQSVAIPTRLTQRHRREAKGGSQVPVAIPKPECVCRGCGKSIRAGRSDCAECAIDDATKRLAAAARLGRVAARTPEAIAKESRTQRLHAAARSSWAASSQPTWLTAEFYSGRIRPVLAAMSTSAIARRIGVSRWYAGRIRNGDSPHPRHWQALAELAGIRHQ
ncbi:MAG TPA: CRISPR-associated endonuclease Cas1 [Terriglobales bacterium]|jgi:CRISPR-associated endonuclease Cas1|nr:CRISPR-associated endonuclease Cas1 [Terriglobales bacterium]